MLPNEVEGEVIVRQSILDRKYWTAPGVPFQEKPIVRTSAALGVVGVGAYFLAQFLQLRGYVNLTASRIDLSLAALIFIVAAYIFSRAMPSRRNSIFLLLTLLIVACGFLLDRLTLQSPKVPVGPRSYQLSFVFKDSPLFSDTTKTFVKDKIEDYFEYLEGTGLSVPRELAPIGVATPDGLGGCGGYSIARPAPLYRQGEIYFEETCLNNGEAITGIYSDWVFQNLLDESLHGLKAGDVGVRMASQKTLSLYYQSSFYGSLSPDAQKGLNSWPVVLWDMRTQFGKDFTDRAIAQAVRSMNDDDVQYKDGIPIDAYWCYHLGIGVSVIDNNHQKYDGIRRLLGLRGLCRNPTTSSGTESKGGSRQ